MPGPWVYFHEATDPLIAGLDTELLAKLDFARNKAGVPFVITSGKRTPEQNAALKGAVQDSAHLSGLGVDLACEDSHQLWAMLFGLYMAGFRRIGVYVTRCIDNPSRLIARHIHVDIDTDPNKPIEVLWISLEQN